MKAGDLPDDPELFGLGSVAKTRKEIFVRQASLARELTSMGLPPSVTSAQLYLESNKFHKEPVVANQKVSNGRKLRAPSNPRNGSATKPSVIKGILKKQDQDAAPCTDALEYGMALSKGQMLNLDAFDPEGVYDIPRPRKDRLTPQGPFKPSAAARGNSTYHNDGRSGGGGGGGGGGPREWHHLRDGSEALDPRRNPILRQNIKIKAMLSERARRVNARSATPSYTFGHLLPDDGTFAIDAYDSTATMGNDREYGLYDSEDTRNTSTDNFHGTRKTAHSFGADGSRTGVGSGRKLDRSSTALGEEPGALWVGEGRDFLRKAKEVDVDFHSGSEQRFCDSASGPAAVRECPMKKSMTRKQFLELRLDERRQHRAASEGIDPSGSGSGSGSKSICSAAEEGAISLCVRRQRAEGTATGALLATGYSRQGNLPELEEPYLSLLREDEAAARARAAKAAATAATTDETEESSLPSSKFKQAEKSNNSNYHTKIEMRNKSSSASGSNGAAVATEGKCAKKGEFNKRSDTSSPLSSSLSRKKNLSSFHHAKETATGSQESLVSKGFGSGIQTITSFAETAVAVGFDRVRSVQVGPQRPRSALKSRLAQSFRGGERAEGFFPSNEKEVSNFLGVSSAALLSSLKVATKTKEATATATATAAAVSRKLSDATATQRNNITTQSTELANSRRFSSTLTDDSSATLSVLSQLKKKSDQRQRCLEDSADSADDSPTSPLHGALNEEGGGKGEKGEETGRDSGSEGEEANEEGRRRMGDERRSGISKRRSLAGLTADEMDEHKEEEAEPSKEDHSRELTHTWTRSRSVATPSRPFGFSGSKTWILEIPESRKTRKEAIREERERMRQSKIRMLAEEIANSSPYDVSSSAFLRVLSGRRNDIGWGRLGLVADDDDGRTGGSGDEGRKSVGDVPGGKGALDDGWSVVPEKEDSWRAVSESGDGKAMENTAKKEEAKEKNRKSNVNNVMVKEREGEDFVHKGGAVHEGGIVHGPSNGGGENGSLVKSVVKNSNNRNNNNSDNNKSYNNNSNNNIHDGFVSDDEDEWWGFGERDADGDDLNRCRCYDSNPSYRSKRSAGNRDRGGGVNGFLCNSPLNPATRTSTKSAEDRLSDRDCPPTYNGYYNSSSNNNMNSNSDSRNYADYAHHDHDFTGHGGENVNVSGVENRKKSPTFFVREGDFSAVVYRARSMHNERHHRASSANETHYRTGYQQPIRNTSPPEWGHTLDDLNGQKASGGGLHTGGGGGGGLSDGGFRSRLGSRSSGSGVGLANMRPRSVWEIGAHAAAFSEEHYANYGTHAPLDVCTDPPENEVIGGKHRSKATGSRATGSHVGKEWSETDASIPRSGLGGGLGEEPSVTAEWGRGVEKEKECDDKQREERQEEEEGHQQGHGEQNQGHKEQQQGHGEQQQGHGAGKQRETKKNEEHQQRRENEHGKKEEDQEQGIEIEIEEGKRLRFRDSVDDSASPSPRTPIAAEVDHDPINTSTPTSMKAVSSPPPPPPMPTGVVSSPPLPHPPPPRPTPMPAAETSGPVTIATTSTTSAATPIATTPISVAAVVVPKPPTATTAAAATVATGKEKSPPSPPLAPMNDPSPCERQAASETLVPEQRRDGEKEGKKEEDEKEEEMQREREGGGASLSGMEDAKASLRPMEFPPPTT